MLRNTNSSIFNLNLSSGPRRRDERVGRPDARVLPGHGTHSGRGHGRQGQHPLPDVRVPGAGPVLLPDVGHDLHPAERLEDRPRRLRDRPEAGDGQAELAGAQAVQVRGHPDVAVGQRAAAVRIPQADRRRAEEDRREEPGRGQAEGSVER